MSASKSRFFPGLFHSSSKLVLKLEMRKIWGQISHCDFVVFCFHYFWCGSLPWTMGNCPVGSSRGFCHFYLYKLLCRYNNATLVFLFSLLKLAFAKLLVTLYNKFRLGLDFQILLSVNFDNLFLNISRPLEQNCFRAHISKFLLWLVFRIWR